MEFQLRDVLYVVGLAVSVVITFFSARYGVKEYTRDKCEDLKKDISDLKLRIKDLESKDNLQQQILDQLGEHTKELIPKLMDMINYKKVDK